LTGTFNVNLLKQYIRSASYDDGEVSVMIDMGSSRVVGGFWITLTASRPLTGGAFPPARFAFEDHGGFGHKGVHIQVNYHLMENELKIGRLYITLEVRGVHDLQSLSEGFIYTLREILIGMGSGFNQASSLIFREELLSDLTPQKTLLMDRIRESVEGDHIEIRDHTRGIHQPTHENTMGLLRSRRELIPLLGPLIDVRHSP